MPIGFWSISRLEIKRMLQAYIAQGTLPKMTTAELENRITYIKSNIPLYFDSILTNFVLDPHQYGYKGK